MSFRLYGTALCQTVLDTLGDKPWTVAELIDEIGPSEMDSTERHNLDRRIRRALDTLKTEQHVEMEWRIDDRPVQTFKIISDGQKFNGGLEHAQRQSR